jgi:hypothetical protein
VLVNTPFNETVVTPVKVTSPPLAAAVPPELAIEVGVIKLNPDNGAAATHAEPFQNSVLLLSCR